LPNLHEPEVIHAFKVSIDEQTNKIKEYYLDAAIVIESQSGVKEKADI
jgi:hypothetical protein